MFDSSRRVHETVGGACSLHSVSTMFNAWETDDLGIALLYSNATSRLYGWSSLEQHWTPLEFPGHENSYPVASGDAQ